MAPGLLVDCGVKLLLLTSLLSVLFYSRSKYSDHNTNLVYFGSLCLMC